MDILSRLLYGWMRRKAAFIYPIPPAPPTAVLTPWHRSTGLIRVFPDGWGAAAAAFAPAAIAGTWPQLEALIPEQIPSLTHALIVQAQPGEPPLTKLQREKLWRVFSVPIFQQIVDPRGVLLAAECEAHDGLHLESSKFVGKDQAVDLSICGCGRKTPRLKRADRQAEVQAAIAVAR